MWFSKKASGIFLKINLTLWFVLCVFVAQNTVFASGVTKASTYNPTSVTITGGTINGVSVAGIGAKIGYLQTFQNMLGSRLLATPYTNNTGNTIIVYVQTITGSYPETLTVTVDGLTMTRSISTANSYTNQVIFMVPRGSIYTVAPNTQTISVWNEFR